MRTVEATADAAEGTVATACWLAIGYLVVLLAVGPWLHPMPAIGVENDDFQQLAAAWLRGRPPADVFRPALYPLSMAAVSILTGDLFSAGRVVSSVGAALMVGSVFVLVRRLGRKRLAWFAAISAGLHPVVLEHGLLVATDMLAFGLACLTLAVASSRLPAGGRSRAVGGETKWLAGLAACFALAYWTRYTNLALLVPIVFAVLSAGGDLWRRLARLLGFGALALLFLLPHCGLSLLQFGEPFHDENYRNAALRHYYDLDFTRMAEVPFQSFAEVFLHDPARVVIHASAGLWEFFTVGLPRLMAGGAGSPAWLAVPWLTLAAIGACAVRGPVVRHILCIGGYALAALLAVVLTYQPFERLLLPQWLLVVSLAWVGVDRLATRLPGDGRRWLVALGAVLGLGVVAAIPQRMAGLHRRHIRDVPAAIAHLRQREGRALAVLATAGNVGSVVPEDVVVGALRRTPGRAVGEELDAFLAQARSGGFEFVLVDDYRARADLGGLRRALGDRGIEVVEDRVHALVFRAFSPGSLDVRPDVERFGGLHVRLHVPVPVLAGVDGAALELVDTGVCVPAAIEAGAAVVRVPPRPAVLSQELVLRARWRDVGGRSFAGDAVTIVPAQRLRRWLADEAAPLVALLPSMTEALGEDLAADERARLCTAVDATRRLAEVVPELQRWLHWRELVAARAAEFAPAWRRCRAELPELPAHPELVPIGRHPTSGEWWFYDLGIACGPDRGDEVARCAIPTLDPSGSLEGGDPAAVFVWRDRRLRALRELSAEDWQRFRGAAARRRLGRLGFELAGRRLLRRLPG
ncbi:MAG TPA: hypothetical protein ENI87_03830 [bacterium]|nr:hypothetical protein [bacterium]